ncbi:MAG TPA: hypothetical protein VIV11_01100 [Kofleriaceae bacterium]
MRAGIVVAALACIAQPAAAQAPAEPSEPPAEPAAAEPTPAPAPPAPAAPAPSTSTTSTTAVEPVAPAVHRFAPWQRTRLAIELELYTQARFVRRTGDDLSELRLDRGELGARIGLDTWAAATLRLEAIRSASDGGALGVDGNSTVIRVKAAHVAAKHDIASVQVEGALGFVPDPWLATLESDYTVKPLSRTGSERLLDWPASDLAFVGRATVGPVRFSLSAGNGEGLRYPERNTGKTTTGVLEVVPIATEALRVSIAAVGRDGSLGVASIRDRRAGGGIAVTSVRVRGGAEVVQAWGIGDRGDAKALLASAWADAHVVSRAFVALRGATLGFADDGGRLNTFGGAVAVEPWQDARRGRFRVWLAIDRVTSSGSAMPLPGADPGDATLIMLIASAIAPFTVD